MGLPNGQCLSHFYDRAERAGLPFGNIFPAFATKAVAATFSTRYFGVYDRDGSRERQSRAPFFPLSRPRRQPRPFGTRYFGFYDQVGRRDR